MKDIMFLGDFLSDTGPGVANRGFMKGFSNLAYDVSFSKHNKGIKRLLEAIWGVINAKNVCLCYSSKITYLIIPICKMLRKRVAYLIHGYGKYECVLNKESNERIKSVAEEEDRLYKKSDIIICVSKFFCDYMKHYEPQYTEKYRYFYNAIDVSKMEEYHGPQEKIVLSLGGGLGRKNNIAVCGAIDLLNKKGWNLKYVVIGVKASDYDNIIKYSFVEYHEFMPHEEVLKVMKKAKVYIQNSWLESFGLAPIEAMYCGTSVLITQYQGIKDLFTYLEDDYIIHDPNNMGEIAEKIEKLILLPNNLALIANFNKELVDPTSSAERLFKLITQ